MRRVLTLAILVIFTATIVRAAEAPPDTKKAAETRAKLKTKVTCEYKDTAFKDVIEDLQEQTKVSFRLDTAGGVSLNRKVTYKCKDKPMDEVLEEIFKKEAYGYFVISGEKNAYDSRIQVKQGNERGYPEGVTPPKDTGTKPDPEPKPKPDPEPKPKPDPEPKPKPEDGDKVEEDAARKLKFAKLLIEDGLKEKAKERLVELIEKFPKTKAAVEAKKELEKLGK